MSKLDIEQATTDLNAAAQNGASLKQLHKNVEKLLALQPEQVAKEYGPLLRAYAQWFHGSAEFLKENMLKLVTGRDVEAIVAKMMAHEEEPKPKVIIEYEQRRQAQRVAEIEQEEREFAAEHKKKRNEKGISAKAGSGKPEPRILLVESKPAAPQFVQDPAAEAFEKFIEGKFVSFVGKLMGAAGKGAPESELRSMVNQFLATAPKDFVEERGPEIRLWPAWFPVEMAEEARHNKELTTAKSARQFEAMTKKYEKHLRSLKSKELIAAELASTRAAEQRHEALSKAYEEAQRQAKAATPAMPIGASRFGGMPDLPSNIPWPLFQKKKLPFIAQINLSEVRGKDSPLPKEGWLYAFGLFDNEHSPHPFSVFVHRGPRSKLVRAAQPKEKEIWPDWGGLRVYDLVPITASTKKSGDSDGWLFGKMASWAGTPGDIANDCLRDGDDWINLLAVQSVGSMQWSDCGHLYLLIRKSDLAKRDFSAVLPVVCSS